MKNFLFGFLVFLLIPLQTFAEEAVEVIAEPSVATDILGWIITIPAIGPYVAVIFAFAGFAAALAAVLPVGKEGGTWSKIRKILIDLPAMNFWNAKNKT